MYGFSLAQYTQLCRLIVALSLNVASSDKTNESWKSSLSSHLCRNHSQNCSRLSGSSSFSVRTSLGMEGFHFWVCKIWWTLHFSIAISWEHGLNDCTSAPVISGTSLSSVPTFQHILHRSIDFKLVSDYCYCYSCWWGIPNSTFKRRWTSTTFFTFQ